MMWAHSGLCGTPPPQATWPPSMSSPARLLLVPAVILSSCLPVCPARILVFAAGLLRSEGTSPLCWLTGSSGGNWEAKNRISTFQHSCALSVHTYVAATLTYLCSVLCEKKWCLLVPIVYSVSSFSRDWNVAKSNKSEGNLFFWQLYRCVVLLPVEWKSVTLLKYWWRHTGLCVQDAGISTAALSFQDQRVLMARCTSSESHQWRLKTLSGLILQVAFYLTLLFDWCWHCFIVSWGKQDFCFPFLQLHYAFFFLHINFSSFYNSWMLHTRSGVTFAKCLLMNRASVRKWSLTDISEGLNQEETKKCSLKKILAVM